MEFSELIRARYSVRAYKSDPVEEEKLQYVLEAARLAPTAANKQPFRIYVIPTEGRREELRRICPPEWFSQPPYVIGLVGLPGQCWVRKDGRSYLEVDVAIAMDHLVLAAHDVGLGTCWIAAFREQEAREVLSLPAGVDPIIFTPLGYADDQPGPKQRRELGDLVVDLRT